MHISMQEILAVKDDEKLLKKFIEIHNEVEEAFDEIHDFYVDFFDEYSYSTQYDEELKADIEKIFSTAQEKYYSFIMSLNINDKN